ncbi:cyclin-H-like [Mizuhopecten yessoensis]|uniref:Cyclin-H n=1 Tax=Mizuhopecten yessoensis TaxID=6573 RepID=A0A210QML0_MIZYE|nr:cyclin-H-like [Mizuhopecten yessoensis]OWF49969.1 Cyclin-H [Mizuhopecten yessoensis]
MFSTSTQRKYWTFSGETELAATRSEANSKFIQTHGSHMMEEQKLKHFLTPDEERLICRQIEHVLKEFCNIFQPPMPKCVLGTSICYFKRFYASTSAMDYYPKDIMLTCVYLACKVEEFNVSIGQFVGNLKGDREKFSNIILTFELLLMGKLHYHLTVHNPYRPLEGLLIDIKSRCKMIEDPEKLRGHAEAFVDKSVALTDACLIFSPSQIALAAILTSAAQVGKNMDSYVTGILLQGATKDELEKTIYQIKRLKYMVKSQKPLEKEQVGRVQKKLLKCRNQDNNPDSEQYKRKLREMLDDDEDQQTIKRTKISEEEKRRDKELLGVP